MSIPGYDRLGATYTATRRQDPELAAQIHAALGAGRTLLNVGAGAGAYEPRDRTVLAVEPSPVMIAQRPADAAPAVLAAAERLPFVDASFDAAMALHTVHHWNDPAAGLDELRRVARRVVVVAGDAHVIDRLWLTAEYFPGMAFAARRERAPGRRSPSAWAGAPRSGRSVSRPTASTASRKRSWPGRRPTSTREVRRNMSVFRLLPGRQAAAGVARLRRDLASGAWDARHGHLRRLAHLDTGLRIIVSDPI